MCLNSVMCDKTLHVISKAIYAYIYNSIINKGIKLIPRDEICSDLGIATITFSKYFKPLLERSTVKVTQTYMDGRFYHNTYTIEGVGNIDEHQPEQPQKNKTNPTHECELSSQFKQLWDLYPRKQGKKVAFEKFKKVINNGSATFEQIKDGISKYSEFAKNKDPKFVLMGSTFFDQERWQDQFENDQRESFYARKLKELRKDYIETTFSEVKK